MAAVSTNIKIDPALKQQSQELFTRLGMNLSTAVNVFLRQAVYEQSIPFRIGRAEIPNEETRTAFQEVQEMKKHPSRYKSYTDVDDMMKDILG